MVMHAVQLIALTTNGFVRATEKRWPGGRITDRCPIQPGWSGSALVPPHLGLAATIAASPRSIIVVTGGDGAGGDAGAAGSGRW